MKEAFIEPPILFIGAHPDDIEIGCGGTAAMCADRGDRIAFAIATQSKANDIAKRREREARRAASQLGLSENSGTLFFGTLPDTGLNKSHPELRDWLKKVSRDFGANTVFFHRKDDHSDHQAVFKVSIGVFQRHNILLYYIPRPFPETPFKPNCAVDISKYIKLKVAMCRSHSSQEKDYISSDSVRTNSHYFYQRSYGRRCWKVDGYAEGFALYAWRPATRGNSASNEPSIPDDLHLLMKTDGTFEWED
jgi:LmbE family N-acetylglucosaminyl deacetylase